jgi:hypothetical protein
VTTDDTKHSNKSLYFVYKKTTIVNRIEIETFFSFRDCKPSSIVRHSILTLWRVNEVLLYYYESLHHIIQPKNVLWSAKKKLWNNSNMLTCRRKSKTFAAFSASSRAFSALWAAGAMLRCCCCCYKSTKHTQQLMKCTKHTTFGSMRSVTDANLFHFN